MSQLSVVIHIALSGNKNRCVKRGASFQTFSVYRREGTIAAAAFLKNQLCKHSLHKRESGDFSILIPVSPAVRLLPPLHLLLQTLTKHKQKQTHIGIVM